MIRRLIEIDSTNGIQPRTSQDCKPHFNQQFTSKCPQHSLYNIGPKCLALCLNLSFSSGLDQPSGLAREYTATRRRCGLMSA